MSIRKFNPGVIKLTSRRFGIIASLHRRMLFLLAQIGLTDHEMLSDQELVIRFAASTMVLRVQLQSLATAHANGGLRPAKLAGTHTSTPCRRSAAVSLPADAGHSLKMVLLPSRTDRTRGTRPPKTRRNDEQGTRPGGCGPSGYARPRNAAEPLAGAGAPPISAPSRSHEAQMRRGLTRIDPAAHKVALRGVARRGGGAPPPQPQFLPPLLSSYYIPPQRPPSRGYLQAPA